MGILPPWSSSDNLDFVVADRFGEFAHRWRIPISSLVIRRVRTAPVLACRKRSASSQSGVRQYPARALVFLDKAVARARLTLAARDTTQAAGQRG
jgi:hypothetical protein